MHIHTIKKSKLLSSLLLVTTALFMSGFPLMTFAVGITAATDVMSTQAKAATADHAITWTQGTGHAHTAGDTISIAFTVSGDFTANSAGSWQTTDFSFTDPGISGSPNAPVAVGASPSCSSGAGHYTVTISGTVLPVFLITLCSSYGTATTAGTSTFNILGATGGTGTLTNKNADVNSSTITITDTGSDTDTTTLATAIETNDVVTVTASVDPTLTFAVGSNTASLGTLSSSARASTSHSLAVATNAAGGFLVTYNGATLTSSSSGSPTIAGYSALSDPNTGTAGWGINLKANATPSVGSNPTTNAGATCTPATNYNTADKFTFIPGTTTAITNMSAAADCTFTVSYVANISSVTPAGAYSTALTYVASGSF